MFEIKITNKDRERIHTMNFGTEIEEKLYFRVNELINGYMNGDND